MHGQFYTLQSAILPDLVLCSEPSLYYKVLKGIAVPVESGLRITATSKVSFDTWFGGFSAGKWRRLSVCESFVLKLILEGKGVVSLYRQRRYKQQFYYEMIWEQAYEKQRPESLLIPLPQEYTEGDRLFFVLSAEQQSVLYEARWGTYTHPARSVYLGMVITTFNRKAEVCESAQRLSRFIQQVHQNSGSSVKLALAIVDNGRNLSLPYLPGVKVIPNPNLGGAGGFARGLYYFRHEARATHCLFMDDDAACEPESIWRTIQLLIYAKDDSLAIAGAMLKDSPAYLLHEKGARFRYHCEPLQHNRNVCKSRVLAEVELSVAFDYGGWWFFAFPLMHVKHYPFPFFVRGDDVQFGLAHRFKLETLNGISVWGGDFIAKEGPMSKYLDMRHHIMQHFLTEQLPKGAMRLSVMIWRQWLRYGLTYRYAIAEAQLMAMEDVLKGPEFWARNVDMHETFPQLHCLMKQMKPRQIEELPKIRFYACEIKCRNIFLTLGVKFLKGLTLNGHLIPSFLMKKQSVIVEKDCVCLDAFLGRVEVLQLEPDGQQGLWLKRDSGRFLRLMGYFLMLTLWMMLKRRLLIKSYRQAYPNLTRESFWLSWFKGERGSVSE